MLATVYSTKFDRAGELVSAAKRYILWMQTEEGKHQVVVHLLGQRQRTGVHGGGIGDSAALGGACTSKNPDTCRGDAPSAAFFDEIAFTSADFGINLLFLFSDCWPACDLYQTLPPPRRFSTCFASR